MNKIKLGDFLDFNPPESLAGKKEVKKIPLDALNTNSKTIDYFELSKVVGGAKFRNNDTLVAKITPSLENGKTGKVTILDDDEVGLGSTEFIVLRANKNSDPDFIYYLARSPLFRERAISLMEGTSGRKRVNENTLKNTDFFLPTLSKQKEIASILSTLDDKIELNKKINQELEQLARDLYNYWFVQFDFPDSKGKPYKSSGGKMIYSESIKRILPSGWEVKKLEEVSEIIAGQSPKSQFYNSDGKGYSFLQGNRTFGEFYPNVNSWTTSAKKIVEKDTILMSVRAPVGAMNIANQKIAIGRGLAGIIENNKHQEFLWYTLKSILPLIISKGSGSTYESISSDVLRSISIPYPSESLIHKFDIEAKPIFKKINKNNEEIKKLLNIRDHLLPMLMNGQISIKN